LPAFAPWLSASRHAWRLPEQAENAHAHRPPRTLAVAGIANRRLARWFSAEMVERRLRMSRKYVALRGMTSSDISLDRLTVRFAWNHNQQTADITSNFPACAPRH